jgi:glucose-6-phosphate isomerase
MASPLTFSALNTEVQPDQFATQINAFAERVKNREYGFVNQLFSQDLGEMQDLVNKLEWADTLVVVGIGGSDLGGRTLQNALGKKSDRRVIFHGEFTDPDSMNQMLESIDPHKTVFNIISKSGATAETMSQYYFLKQWLAEKVDDVNQHFVFTTDPQTGILRAEADREGIMTLPIPTQVGGRFSVFTEVGLLPAVWAGWDAGEILNGAKQAIADLQNEGVENVAVQIAVWQYQLYKQGLSINVFWSYASRLTELGRWYRQLWAESSGKDGKGILPIQARGPADQHSQLQYYADGSAQASFMFLQVERFADLTIPQISEPALSFLSGKTFGQLTNVELAATAQALQDESKFVSVLTLQEIGASNVGYLLTVLMLACILVCELLEVNPFDQPGVESSKKLIKQLLSE